MTLEERLEIESKIASATTVAELAEIERELWNRPDRMEPDVHALIREIERRTSPLVSKTMWLVQKEDPQVMNDFQVYVAEATGQAMQFRLFHLFDFGRIRVFVERVEAGELDREDPTRSENYQDYARRIREAGTIKDLGAIAAEINANLEVLPLDEREAIADLIEQRSAVLIGLEAQRLEDELGTEELARRIQEGQILPSTIVSLRAGMDPEEELGDEWRTDEDLSLFDDYMARIERAASRDELGYIWDAVCANAGLLSNEELTRLAMAVEDRLGTMDQPTQERTRGRTV